MALRMHIYRRMVGQYDSWYREIRVARWKGTLVSYKSATLDNGLRTKCMAEVNTFGRTRSAMTGNTKMIKSVDLVFSIGQTENNIKGIGRMVISMGRD